ncbi:unnamed protein product [Symbiodinium sp. KB8]|nr:unnamed protein product [Symbiodinium sp. KB8]
MKGWKAVTSATLEASQQEMERIMQEVDLLRNDSDSESEPSPVPCSSQTSDEWFVFSIKMHLRDVAPRGHPRSSPLSLVSCCTGAFAEAVCLEALGIPFTAVGASECSQTAQKIIMANHPPTHLHDNFRDQIEHETCRLHGPSQQKCGMQQSDLCVCGSPCPPFSTFRSKRFLEGSVRQHGQTDTTMLDARDMLLHGQHKAFILEQVPGFDQAETSRDSSESPMRRFLNMIQTELKVAKKPGYHAVVLRASHQDWVQLMRDRIRKKLRCREQRGQGQPDLDTRKQHLLRSLRIYIVFLRKDVYGVADAGFLAKTYKDLIAKQRQVAPKKLGDVLPERALEDIPPGGVQRSIFEDSDLASRRWKVDSKAFRSSLGVSENYKEEVVPGVDVRAVMDGKFIDVSQGVKRGTHTNKSGFVRTFTTSTVLYDFSRDCVLTGYEMLLLHGFPRDFVIPPEIPETEVRKVAGEGMSIPSLAAVIWCLYLTRQFPE